MLGLNNKFHLENILIVDSINYTYNTLKKLLLNLT
jgi:hypothetical protein